MTRKTPPQARPISDGARLRSIFAGSAGNLVEWYDWYVYSAFSLYFASVFFPSGDRNAELLSAAAVFAVGFVARPAGAWVMGIYADRRGRKAGLTLSVTMMCIGSLVIAVTPGHERIGIAAPAILTVARLIQGLSVGGEYGASATYLSEVAKRSHRGLWSSLQYVTLILGQLLALGVLLLLQTTLERGALEAWGWRIPFVIGGVLSVAVFWLRRGLVESNSYRGGEGSGKASAWSALRRVREHQGGAAASSASRPEGRSRSTPSPRTCRSSSSTPLGSTRRPRRASPPRRCSCSCCSSRWRAPSPIASAQAVDDRVRRRGVLFTYPLLTAIGETRDPVTAFALVLTALVIVTGYTSINAVVKAEIFPAEIRALGVALPYAIANTVFGGTAEYVALRFKGWGAESGFFLYVTFMIAVSLVVYVRMPDTREHSRIVSE